MKRISNLLLPLFIILTFAIVGCGSADARSQYGLHQTEMPTPIKSPTTTFTPTSLPTTTQSPEPTSTPLLPIPNDVLLGVLFCQQTQSGYSLNLRTWYDSKQVEQWIREGRVGLQIGDSPADCALTGTHTVNCNTTSSGGKVQISNLVDGIAIRSFPFDLDNCRLLVKPSHKGGGGNSGNDSGGSGGTEVPCEETPAGCVVTP